MLESVGKETVEKLDKIVDKLPPLIRDVEMRLFGGLHGLLDRVDCDLSFHFAIKPPKGKAANPAPEQDKVY